MSVLQANCPSCGGQVQFTAGSTIVVVCPYCRSAIARTDRGLEDIGKVAEIADSESPLKVGLKGTYKDTKFELTGRAQMRHELGGYWDEWYATFSNGWVGWLAEAQGRFYLTFYQPLPTGTALPPFNDLQLGEVVDAVPSPTPLMVQERGHGTTVAADGEIPYKLSPGEQFAYADLAGKNNAFATIDYSTEPPWVFLGSQVTLAEIGLGDAKPVNREARQTTGAALRCPNCGGPLDLVAPDKTERVTCPNCNSLLDVNQGNLTYLKSLAPPANAPDFVAPIGAEGVFPGDVRFKIIGAVVRSVTIEGIKYFWHEYLLYNPMVGFRWLVHSDNHWNFVEPINPAEVEDTHFYGAGAKVKYNGEEYKNFQDAEAVVEYVKGEFYWRVEHGETVRATDYVNPPRMLSREATKDEVNWSLGTYVPVEDVERIFGISGLPRPWGVAPNQPFTGRFYYTWGALPLLLLMIVAIFMIPMRGITKTALNQQLALPPMANAGSEQTASSQAFDLTSNNNVRITASANVNNSWADLDVDLYNEQNQEIESVNVPIEYYSGVDDGESWSEGDQSPDATISSPGAGHYTLQVHGTWEQWQQPMNVQLKVEQGVNRGVNFLCAFLVLLIVPVLGFLRKFSFESARWRDSMFGSSGGSSSSGDDDSDSFSMDSPVENYNITGD
jgi:Zn finger protein HypA/HybF involved in hydrogenase expression